jgi:hypothetical protein
MRGETRRRTLSEAEPADPALREAGAGIAPAIVIALFTAATAR